MLAYFSPPLLLFHVTFMLLFPQLCLFFSIAAVVILLASRFEWRSLVGWTLCASRWGSSGQW